MAETTKGRSNPEGRMALLEHLKELRNRLFKAAIAVVLVCLFSAMAAPGADATSMFYLAVPLLVLFFAAIGLCVLNDRRRERRAIRLAAETEATSDTAPPTQSFRTSKPLRARAGNDGPERPPRMSLPRC